MKDYPKVNRVEVINQNGRACSFYECKDVKIDIQDNGKTIKVFLVNNK